MQKQVYEKVNNDTKDPITLLWNGMQLGVSPLKYVTYSAKKSLVSFENTLHENRPSNTFKFWKESQ